MNKTFITISLFAFAAVGLSAQVPSFAGCQILPANNVWNTPIDYLPVAVNSGAYVHTLGSTSPLHPDYGSTGGYEIAVVPGTEPKFPVSFYYSGDPGPYPIPPNPPIEPGSDHHLFIIDKTNCIDYELFNLQRQSNGTWRAGGGVVFPLNSDGRPDAWADASGTLMVPGMIRYDEVAAGAINHAIAFTGFGTANYAIWPARSYASSLSGAQYPPMGQRFRLKASVNISGFSPKVQVILTALKKYGMILMDNGTSWHIQGVEDARWNDDEMHTLTQLDGADFEAVDESSLMVSRTSLQAQQSAPTGPSTVPTGWTEIVSQNSGQCLDVIYISGTNWARNPGTHVQQWPCWSGPNQQFMLTPVSGGYKITVQVSGLQLDVAGDSRSAGALLLQWPYWGGPNEIFTLSEPDSEGFFSITPTNSGQCLDVISTAGTNWAQKPATHVQQYPCWGGPMQKWKFVAP